MLLRLLASALLAFSLCAQTTVTDTVRTPVNNTLFSGKVQIIGPAVTYGGVTYGQAARRITVTAGAFSATLIPNTTASPSGTSYAVRFTANEGISWDETWVVPVSGSPVTIGSIRSTVPLPSTTIALSQLPTCADAQVYQMVSGAWACSSAGSGTVTSVGLSLPAELTVSNSPVTTTGTLTGTWANQTTNKVFAAPNGSTGTPSFRALASADIPDLATSKITSGTLDTARLGSGAANNTTYLRGDQTWQTVTSGPANTDALTEGSTNLYFTIARARATVSATAPLLYDSGTGVFSMPAATSSANGYLTSADWSTFNGKAAASHAHAASDITSGTIAIARGGTNAATTSQNFAFIGPLSGSGAPSFRALDPGDIPALAASKITSGVLDIARLATGTPDGTKFVRDDGTLAVPGGSSTANYSQSFTAQTSVSLTHGLGTPNVIVACYDASDVMVEPNSITIAGSSPYAVAVTFAAAQTGRCVVNGSGGGGSGSSFDPTTPANLFFRMAYVGFSNNDGWTYASCTDPSVGKAATAVDFGTAAFAGAGCLVWWSPNKASLPQIYGSTFTAAFRGGRNTPGGDIYFGVFDGTAANGVGVRWNNGSSTYQCVVRNGGADSGSPVAISGANDTNDHWFVVSNDGTAGRASCVIDGGTASVVTGATHPSVTPVMAIYLPASTTTWIREIVFSATGRSM